MGRLRARVPDNTDAMDLADELGGDARSFPEGEARAKNVTFTGITYVGVDQNVRSTTTTTINTAEKDDSTGGLNDSSSGSTPATATAASVHHHHPVDPGSREEVAPFALHEGFAATRHQTSRGRRLKIVASLRANNAANTSSTGGAGATQPVGDKNSPPPPGVMSMHDPAHRRHWQKMKHMALDDRNGSVPQTVAARRAAGAMAARNPSSSSAAAASSSSLRNVLDASPQPASSDVAATPAGTTAAAEAAAAAATGGVGGGKAAAAPTTSSMRSPSFRIRRVGRSSSIGGGGRREEESQERAIAIGFQDAELLAWLNSVLFFSVGGEAASTAAGDGLDEFAAKQKQMG